MIIIWSIIWCSVKTVLCTAGFVLCLVHSLNLVGIFEAEKTSVDIIVFFKTTVSGSLLLDILNTYKITERLIQLHSVSIFNLLLWPIFQ